MFSSASISITFPGSKPKLPCNERISPRTATIEEVTSTAQMAICATISTSRTVMRLPTLVMVPDLTISYGFVCSTCLTGTAPKQESAGDRQQQRDSINIRIGVQGHVDGKSRKWLPHAQPAQHDNTAP